MTSKPTPRLEFRAQQQVAMTPQLQQALKLLELPLPELQAYIEQELEKNPLLQREDGETVEPQEAAEAGEDGEESAGEPSPVDHSGDGDDWAEEDGFLEASISYASKGSGWDGEDDASGWEQQVAAEAPGLREHLLRQLQMDVPDAGIRLIAANLVDLLDDDGYCRESLEALSERLGCTLEETETALAAVQGCDPSGIGARDLKECLALQLKEQNRLDPAMQALLDRLDLLAKGDAAALKRASGLSDRDFADAVAEIKALDPRPGSRFTKSAAQAVIPDVFVRRLKNGDYHVELNTDQLPRLLIDKRYAETLSGRLQGREDKRFMAEHLQSARWLIRTLDERARRMLEVSLAIVNHQKTFLDHGVRHLRGLTLQEIADELNIHISTVSRIVTGKYAATPRGTIELRYFFSSSVGGQGEEVASEAVRYAIRDLVAAETHDRILSDEDLVVALKAEGIEAARRTVAKYREAMGIPSSYERRKLKKTSSI
ncbi:MAG: RNA polymerase factor sigma-54 [Alphaproteobacteria bacterium]|nr:RNA polymerase factor sigma-54 [Alphaproteobacteria bacterium]